MATKRISGARRAPTADATAPAVESIRRSLVALRRLFQRRELAEMWAQAFGDRSQLDYNDLRLLDAVRVSGAAEGATVGAVARLLGIDPSRASRQVAKAVGNGLLLRQAEQGDARKVVMKITIAGAKLLERGSEVSRSRIALALTSWPAAERQRLASLLDRLVDHLSLDQPAPAKKSNGRGER